MGKSSVVRLKKVIETLNSGDARGAIALIRELLSEDAHDPDLLGLLGVALEEVGDIDGGADALRRALSLPADSSIELRNASNFAALLFDSGKRKEAVDLLRKGWRWPTDKVLEDKERSCVRRLAKLMNFFELRAEIVAFLSPIVKASQHDWEILRHLTLALAGLGRTEEALRLVEENRLADTKEIERQAILAYIYLKAGHLESARTAQSTYLTGAPPYLAPAQPRQSFTIGVIDPMPSIDRIIKPAHTQHFLNNFPRSMAHRLADRYRFASILFGSGPEAVEKIRGYEPRVVINNVVSSEYLTSFDHLSKARAFIEAIGAPLINAPEPAAQCTRQLNSTRLSGITNMLVPRVSRFRRDVKRLDELVTAIEKKFAYPIIVRTVGEHEAANITLVHTRMALREVLLRLTQMQIYVIQYVGASRRYGFYRRIRAAFIEGVPIIVRADYAHEWIVQSRNIIPLEPYRNRPDLLADANDIINRPHDRLGAPAMETLDAVGRLITLDIFGMDFDIDDDGRIVFFEANASMDLFSNAPQEFPYPPEAESSLVAHIERLLQRKALT